MVALRHRFLATIRSVFTVAQRDDLAQNVSGAERVGMTGVHHTDSAETIRQLEALFELELAAR